MSDHDKSDQEKREQEQEQSGFRVEDKRRFTADGEARDAAAESAGAEDRGPAGAQQPASAAADSSSDAPPDTHRTAEAPSDAPTETPSDEIDGPGPAPGELNFSSFVVGLASQAFMFLGLSPDPQSGVVHRDLAQARAMIDILGMLREKTAGNLSEDEDQMMEELLYELRMQYVRETRADVPGQGENQ